MSVEQTSPLTKVPLGERVRLISIEGGRELTRRLAELGLTTGVELRVLQDSGGPVILAVRDSRIALGRGMADKIIVTVGEEPAL